MSNLKRLLIPTNFMLPKPLFSLPLASVLSVVLLIAFVMSSTFGVVIFSPLVFPNQSFSDEQMFEMAKNNGTVISFTMLMTFFVMLGCIALFIRLKKGSFREFMAIKGFGWGQFLGFGVALLLLNALITGVTNWLELEPMDFMNELASSASSLWLLVFVIVVVVPIYEELMFRGFIWSALAGTRLGVWGTSIITSIIFALVHGQYGVIEWVGIFLLAMLFSLARIRSGSLLLPMTLHMMNNGLAMAEFLQF